MVKNFKNVIVIAALTASLAFTAACGAKTDSGNKAGDKADVKKLSGEIKIDGSSTVFPITQAVAEEFNKTQKDVKIPVGVSGTGGGFKKFTKGETDISDASRPIKDAEKEEAKKNGIEYIEMKVAYDGIAVVVNKSNSFLENITVADLKKIWQPESKVTTWKDVNSSWPDEKIKLYGPGADSGTFDYFTEAINGKEKAIRKDYTPSEDDNVLVQGVAGDKNSMGYFGYAYYLENKDKLKLIGIDPGTGTALKPDIDSIKKGTYKPLARPIFIYVNKKSLEKEEVKEFVKFYMQNGAKLSESVGYVPLDDNDYKAQGEQIK